MINVTPIYTSTVKSLNLFSFSIIFQLQANLNIEQLLTNSSKCNKIDNYCITHNLYILFKFANSTFLGKFHKNPQVKCMHVKQTQKKFS